MSSQEKSDIWVLNGPNLDKLGFRQPLIYGTATYNDVVQLCHTTAEELDVRVKVQQTNAESQMVEWLHAAADASVPVVLNAAAWTHYSIAVADACAMLRAPLCELHISNVYKRESFRHTSVIAPFAHGVITGWGIEGYALAMRAVMRAAQEEKAGTA